MTKINAKTSIFLTAIALPVLTSTLLTTHTAQGQPPAPKGRSSEAVTRIPITFTGGYATDPRDHGRPVVLIAAALGVPTDVFRNAFSNVTPASGGREPQPDQVRRNKGALLRVLSPYGITNERLDSVSDYYRYNGSRGEMWRNTPAAAYATVRNGAVTGITLTNSGSGYSAPPQASLPGMEKVRLTTTLTFSTEFSKNGAIKAIVAGASGKSGEANLKPAEGGSRR